MASILNYAHFLMYPVSALLVNKIKSLQKAKATLRRPFIAHEHGHSLAPGHLVNFTGSLHIAL